MHDHSEEPAVGLVMAKLVPIRVGPLDHICLSILQETYIANLDMKWEKVFLKYN